MKTLLEIALMSERTSSMDPEVRKTFSQVNRFLQGNVLNRNYGTLKPNLAKSLSDLDDNDKERFVKIIKSLTLLTSGNVAMVRDFGKSWSKEEASNWDSILSQNSDAVLKHLGFDTSQEVTARDYYEAGWHLEKISGESNIEFVGSRFDNPDFEGNTGLTQKGLEMARADSAEEFKEEIGVLYRGFHGIAEGTLAVWLSMATTVGLNIGRASSASTRVAMARSYAVNGDNYAVLFVMKNPKKIGLDARKFSKYPNEMEVIINGDFVVDTIAVSEKQFGKGSPMIGDPLEIDGIKLQHTKADGGPFDSVPYKKIQDLLGKGFDLGNRYKTDYMGNPVDTGMKIKPVFVFYGTLSGKSFGEAYQALTTNALKEIIQEEINAVTQEFRMPDKQFDIDVDIEPQSEPETKRIFKYTPNKQAAQAFLQQQFKIPQR
tara:strand:- start:3834 stop:5126 length:1293 start_codon:yes stop_codon:yes gene_type:complete